MGKGQYSKMITAIGIGGNEIDKVTLAPKPEISTGAVVNAASFTPALAPGSLISLFGSNLAFERLPASSLPLPRSSSCMVMISTASSRSVSDMSDLKMT